MERILGEFAGKQVRVFVIWEPVLMTDWSSPSTAALRRVSDLRAVQFWDKSRLISRAMGERDGHGIVWDHIAIYTAGEVWADAPPRPIYDGGPVVRVIEPARAALDRALREQAIEVH